MKRAMLTILASLPLFTANTPATAIDADAQALIDDCRTEASKKGAENIDDYINDCLDKKMQYDTSSD